MDNEALIAVLKEKFQQGKSKADIQRELVVQGWKEQDIDNAISSIQHEALKQLPGFSHFFRWFEDPQLHAKLNTPRMAALILAGCVIVVLGLTYLFFNPFTTQESQRDTHREADLELLKSALGHYYTLHNSYPSSLRQLTPEILQTIPRDPASGEDYNYSSQDNGRNFQLCITFEVQTIPCIYSTPPKAIAPGDSNL